LFQVFFNNLLGPAAGPCAVKADSPEDLAASVITEMMALSYCRWVVPARNFLMEFARTDRKTLLTRATTNRGKPPDHGQPIHNI
jgi:hypothetical protein